MQIKFENFEIALVSASDPACNGNTLSRTQDDENWASWQALP